MSSKNQMMILAERMARRMGDLGIWTNSRRELNVNDSTIHILTDWLRVIMLQSMVTF